MLRIWNLMWLARGGHLADEQASQGAFSHTSLRLKSFLRRVSVCWLFEGMRLQFASQLYNRRLDIFLSRFRPSQAAFKCHRLHAQMSSIVTTTMKLPSCQHGPKSLSNVLCTCATKNWTRSEGKKGSNPALARGTYQRVRECTFFCLVSPHSFS